MGIGDDFRETGKAVRAAAESAAAAFGGAFEAGEIPPRPSLDWKKVDDTAGYRLKRAIDYEAGVVLYREVKSEKMGLAAVPIDQTDLDPDQPIEDDEDGGEQP